MKLEKLHNEKAKRLAVLSTIFMVGLLAFYVAKQISYEIKYHQLPDVDH